MNLKIPAGLTEEMLLKRIDAVINNLAHNYVFGYYDLDDIKQEARIFVLKEFHRYDESRPLENFVYTIAKTRLINLIRNKYHRSDPPCKNCHGEIDGQTQHDNGKYCEKYLAWKKRNADKAGLVNALDISNIDDTEESNTKLPDQISENIAKTEIFNLIDVKLPASMRADYLKMWAGLSINKVRRDAIIKTIRDFLTNEEIDDIYE